MENSDRIHCVGCGAAIQTGNSAQAGFLPTLAMKKWQEGQPIYCRRCFRLRHYSETAAVELTDDDFRRILTEIGNQDALIVNVVDIFDFNGSLIPSLHRFTQKNAVLLVANKLDILPRALNPTKLTNWLKKEAEQAGLRPREVLLTSARRQPSVRALMEAIEHYRRGRDVYVVGVTNVGKSTLINTMIKVTTGEKDVITTSHFPGTTLDKIEIPLDEKSVLVDTPGIIQCGQMAHLLNDKDLKFVSPKKEIKPRTYQLNARQTLFVGALARFDFLSGERQGFTAYFENSLAIHRTKLENAESFYAQHAGELLQPVPQLLNSSKQESVAPLVRKEFSIKEKSDIVIEGLGWICIPKQATVAVWVPAGVDLIARKALI